MSKLALTAMIFWREVFFDVQEDFMSKVVAINGSPRAAKGFTAMLLAPFLEGIKEAGFEVSEFFPTRMNIKRCNCSEMNCWYKTPGKCQHTDDMDKIYPELWQAEILILATPVYVPLPGEMQDFINRLCPLMQPYLEFHEGRTRARLYQDVAIKKIVLVATGGWWEKENMDTVKRIAMELARDMNVEFAGALLRPHAAVMLNNGAPTSDAVEIFKTAKQAGYNLIKNSSIDNATLDSISRPLIPEEVYRKVCNGLLAGVARQQ